MKSLIKIIVLTKSLHLLLLLSPLSAQISSSSDSWILSSLGPTPSGSNMSASTKADVLASMQPQSVDRSSNVTVENNEEGSKAMKYFHTNEDSLLTSSSCHQSFQLARPQGAVPSELQIMLSQVTLSLTNTVNFLNLIFQASELRETSVQEDIEWYHSLVRSMLVSEKPSLVRHARLRFYADPKASRPQLVIQASRIQSLGIYLQDLTSSWKSSQLSSNGLDPSGLIKSSSPRIAGLSEQVLVNDLSTLDTPKWTHGGTYVTNSSGLQWGMVPFLECKGGRFLPEWLLTLSMPFYGLKPDLSPEFRGVIQVDVNIQGFDINQCITGDAWFADTHECNKTSMKCEPIPGQGFRFGQYCCICKEGYYSLPSDTENQRNNVANYTRMCYPEIPVCLPCWPGCKRCKNGSPCLVEEDWLLRTVMLVLQGFFIVLVLLTMLITYKNRRARRIRSSGVLLLEIVLFGSVLLYFPVFILYFKPSLFRCILLRWVRLLGFTMVYGTGSLKMYRLLNVFLSCTAQRVLYMSNASILRMLGVMVLIVKWFLCAWTAGILQNRDHNVVLLITSTPLNGQSFKMCDSDWWDYMMAMAELLFLCWGSLLYTAVKSVPSAFHEPRYMGIAIHNELCFSTIFHLLRFKLISMHPDWMLSLFFVHTHATITVTLALLFIPKFLYIAQPAKEDTASEMYEDEVDLRHSYIHLKSSFSSTCWSDHTLEPDDFRDELKKVYARLEIQKTKKIANKNPHLQKKRTSRLMFGRSIIKHIVEIPESMTQQCSHKDKNILGTTASGYSKESPESTCVTMRNEKAKMPSTEIKKSQCACKYVPERDTLLINFSVKDCTEKRASNTESIKTTPVMRAAKARSINTTPVKRASKAESIDTVPVVGRSVSAHNLAVENNLLQPVLTRIHKSYSFSEMSRNHYALFHTTSPKDTSHALEISPKDTSAQSQDSDMFLFSNAEEKQPTGTEIIKQKQVINSVSQQEPPAHKPFSSSSPPLYVCPWEVASSLPPHLTVGGHGMVSDIESQRSSTLVSCSAPASPHGIVRPISHQRFSLRSATQTLRLARQLVPGSGKCSDKNKHTVSSTNSSGRTPQIPRQALTCDNSKPCLMKQAAIGLSSYDSTEGNSRNNASPQFRLWKSEDMEVGKPSPFGNIVQRLSLTPSTESNKSTCHQFRSSLMAPKSDLCPCNVPNQSHIANISPRELTKPGQMEPEGVTGHISYLKANSKQTQMTMDLVDICPWVAPELASETTDELRKVLSEDKGCIEACNESVGNSLLIKSESVKFSSTTRPSERIIYDDSCAGNKKMKSMGQHETLRSDICPWETSDAVTDQKMSKMADLKSSTSSTTLYSNIQLNGTADICPWDLPETHKSNIQDPQRLKNDCVTVCHWESENLSNTIAEQSRIDVKKKSTMHLLTKRSTNTADICPWDFPESSHTVVDYCSLKTAEPSPKPKQSTEEYSTQESTNTKADVCPRLLVKTESLQETCIAVAIQKPENAYAEIVEMSSDSTQSQSNTKYDSKESEKERPRISDDPGTGESNVSKEDNCAFDVQRKRTNHPLTRCDALCLWEIKYPSITEHKNSDAFTWEEPIPDEGDAETAAEAFIFPPDL